MAERWQTYQRFLRGRIFSDIGKILQVSKYQTIKIFGLKMSAPFLVKFLFILFMF
jgi:hypothetical protein